MGNPTILERIRKIVSRYVECDALEPDTNLIRERGVSSLTMLAITMDLEEEFGIRFPYQRLIHFRTANDIMDCLEDLEREDFFCRESGISKESLASLPYMFSINGLLDMCRDDYAGREAISDGKVTYTYQELFERVGRRRKDLEQLNLNPGSHIGVMAGNSMDAMELFLAVTTAGYVVMMLPDQLKGEALEKVLRKFDIAAVYAGDRFFPLFAGFDGIQVRKADSIAEEAADMADNRKDTTAAIYLTSGTTGEPKGVVLSHGALMRGAYNGIFVCGPKETVPWERRYITFLPFSHIFGTVMGYLSALYTGSIVYACTDIREGLRSMPIWRPTVLILVPEIAEIILAMAKAHGKGFLGGLECMILGAARVPTWLFEAYKEFDVRAISGYGMTEGANLTSGGADDRKPESVGRIYPGQRVKVVDGELWISGDNLMDGYYKEPELTRAALVDGWLRTGDLVSFDEEGFLYIRGRAKNVIILSNGENICPEELENMFYNDVLVKKCCVKETEVNGRRVLGIDIVPNKEIFPKSTADEIKYRLQETLDRINETLPSYKQIAVMQVLEQ